jgi:siderophore synthetase component
MVLEDSRLPYKGNLLTRVHDVDELNADLEMAVYTSIANPLYRLDQSSQTPSTMNNMAEVGHDVA